MHTIRRTAARRWAVAAGAALLATSMAACGSSEPSAKLIRGSDGDPVPNPKAPAYARILTNEKVEVDTSKWAKEGPYKIAALTQGPINAWGSMFDAELKVASKSNPDISALQVLPSMASAEKQVQDLDSLAQHKPDAVIVTPMNVAALSASMTRLQNAGVPVVLCQARSDGAGWVTEVSQPLYPNNFEAAVHVAQMLNGKGNVVILNGSPGVDMADIAKTAIHDALEAYPDIHIVGEGAGNWSTADSKKLAAGWIASGKQIDGVISPGMEMGLGAMQAFIDSGKPLPKISGTGAMNGFNRLAMENDAQFWSKAFSPGVASECLNTTLKVLKGEKVTKFVDAEKEMPGNWTFDTANAKETYQPTLADQLSLGPTRMSAADLAAAGFSR
jgi:ribose transport system substrate-binding protein